MFEVNSQAFINILGAIILTDVEGSGIIEGMIPTMLWCLVGKYFVLSSFVTWVLG